MYLYLFSRELIGLEWVLPVGGSIRPHKYLVLEYFETLIYI